VGAKPSALFKNYMPKSCELLVMVNPNSIIPHPPLTMLLVMLTVLVMPSSIQWTRLMVVISARRLPPTNRCSRRGVSYRGTLLFL
jgi:hypothetical protein